MNSSELTINQIIDKINEAADSNSPLNLTSDEIKILSKEIGDMVFIPVLSWDQVSKLPGKKIGKTEED
ncbi:hypothetical protein [Acinetobacter sp. 243_ASPC]|uniref:hypothetical protein n=1 Tax=Acinetobacter sp. 243_ASPC TaxID=1579345 RepID=UPI000660C189|nr:hypothetical protein [Acinetobacter sp. 243_ASPC]